MSRTRKDAILTVITAMVVSTLLIGFLWAVAWDLSNQQAKGQTQKEVSP